MEFSEGSDEVMESVSPCRSNAMVARSARHLSPRSRMCVREACRNDARVALFEAVFVRLTVHMGRTMAVPEGATPASGPTVPSHARSNGSPSWEQSDSVDLSERLLRREPTLKSCPCFLRGRLRQCWGFALRERCRAKLVDAEVRAWNLFCLVPMMILCRPRSVGSVGRDELAKRIDDFEDGRWVELCSSCVHSGREAQDAMHRRGRNDSPWAGRPKPGRKRTSFSSTPRTRWCTISPTRKPHSCDASVHRNS